MRRYLIGTIAIFALLFASYTPCYASQKLTYNNFEYSENETGITIESYFGSEETVDIPTFITSKRVTEIADYAFLLCNNVKTINVPESVVIIGEKAFSGAANLEFINTVQENKGDTTDNPPTDTGKESGGIEQDIDDDGQKDTNSTTNGSTNGIKVDKTKAIITVDANHRLVVIDADGNQVILDNTKSYSIKERRGKQPKIFNEDGEEVTVDTNGNVKIPGVTEEMSLNDSHMIKVLCVAVIIMLIAAFVFLTFRKKKQKS